MKIGELSSLAGCSVPAVRFYEAEGLLQAPLRAANNYRQYGQQHVDRLAFIDGQYDPWRPATVHSEEYAYGGNRPDTVQRPFKLIPDCWHHCDENGVKDEKKTPERVRLIHEQQVAFVKEWLKQDD